MGLHLVNCNGNVNVELSRQGVIAHIDYLVTPVHRSHPTQKEHGL